MCHKKLLTAICCVLALPCMANAAGTYYTGNTYESVQYNYSASGRAPSSYTPKAQTYNSGAYNSARYQPSQGSARNTGQYSNYNTRQTAAQQKKTPQKSSGGADAGFYADAGISHQFASWEFEMKQAGSKLNYNNVGWNVLDVNLGYNFGKQNYGLFVDAGLMYGMQSGKSQMIDDDISNGGYYLDTYYIDKNNNGKYDDGDTWLGDLYGNALSAGTSKGGSMFGYNVGLGLSDGFTLGRVRISPSVGYRSMTYKLNTKNNYGLSIDTGYCQNAHGTDELQCDPLIIIVSGDNTHILWDNKNSSGGYVDTGGTFYYSQPGKSHDYKVEWAGPYVALDFDFAINQNNAINARAELGLPAYSATGNQPYRVDWLHPTSIKDSASIGDAYHLGLAGTWTTALSDRVALQVGFSYDYYTMSGASAKTYLNGEYYLDLYWDAVNEYAGATEAEKEQAAQTANDPTVMGVLDLMETCPGWVCKANNEVDSFYKSLGIRVGLSAKF